MSRKKEIYIGTSGWYYRSWYGPFYKPEHKGYNILSYFSSVFNSVESNAAFYRIPTEKTFGKWTKYVPENFVFSIKLNQTFTHYHRLKLNRELRGTLKNFLEATQILENRLGAILIQTPPGLRYNLKLLDMFLLGITSLIEKLDYKPDIAIELRNRYWFNQDVYELLKIHNVALTIAQSSRYPVHREVTADFLYFRFHGPRELFASLYSPEELRDWRDYMLGIKNIRRIYIYFNNDNHAYAIKNAKRMRGLLRAA